MDANGGGEGRSSREHPSSSAAVVRATPTEPLSILPGPTSHHKVGNASSGTEQRVRGSFLGINTILQQEKRRTCNSQTVLPLSSTPRSESLTCRDGLAATAEEWMKETSGDGKSCNDSGICCRSSLTETETGGGSGLPVRGGNCAKPVVQQQLVLLFPCDEGKASPVCGEFLDWTNSKPAASGVGLAGEPEEQSSSSTAPPSFHSSAVAGGGKSGMTSDGAQGAGDVVQGCRDAGSPEADIDMSQVCEGKPVVQEAEDKLGEPSSKMSVEESMGYQTTLGVDQSGRLNPVGSDSPLGSPPSVSVAVGRKSCKGKGQLVNAISLRLKIKQSAKSATAGPEGKETLKTLLEGKKIRSTESVVAVPMEGRNETVLEEMKRSNFMVHQDGKDPELKSLPGFSGGEESKMVTGEEKDSITNAEKLFSHHNEMAYEETGVSTGKSSFILLPLDAQNIKKEKTVDSQVNFTCVKSHCDGVVRDGDSVEDCLSQPLSNDLSSQDVPGDSTSSLRKRRTSRRSSAGVRRKPLDFIDPTSKPSLKKVCESKGESADVKMKKKKRSSSRSSAGINRRLSDYKETPLEDEEKVPEKKTRRRRRRRATKSKSLSSELGDASPPVDKYASRRGRRPANSSAINDASVIDPASGKRMFPCPQCNKLFTRVEGVKIHLRIHTGEKPYSCEICGKRFHESGGLRHHRNVHVGAKPHPCPYCKKRFTSNYGLHRHVRMHKGDDTYICSECGKTFGEASSLKVHRRIHSGDHPYRCSLCSKTFCQLGNYQSHMRIHTGERPYSCSVCGKSFRQSNVLQKHVRIHSGERPFVCKRCGKAFNDSGHLQRHWRTHTGERPYQCTLCGKRFAQGAQIHRCETGDGQLFHEAGNGPFVFVGSRANRNGILLSSLRLPDSELVRQELQTSPGPVHGLISSSSSSSEVPQLEMKFDAGVPDDALFISGTQVAELDAKTSAEILRNGIFTPATKVPGFDDRLGPDLWDEGTSYEDCYVGSTEEEDIDENDSYGELDEDGEGSAEGRESILGIAEEEEEDADAESSRGEIQDGEDVESSVDADAVSEDEGGGQGSSSDSLSSGLDNAALPDASL